MYQLSFKLNKLFVDGRTYGRTDGRTDGRMDGRTFFPSILLGRLSEVDLIMGMAGIGNSGLGKNGNGNE